MKKMDPYKVIKYPLSTEKTIRIMEAENKLVFVVDRGANKQDIKKALEEVFKVKIESVNTQISRGEKRAFVKISMDTPAIDLATQMGMM